MTSTSNYHYQLTLTYFSFRVFLTLVLATLSLADAHYAISGEYQSTTFLVTSIAYFSLAIINVIHSAFSRLPATEKTLFISVIIDILFCFSLMHLSGGFETGLGILLLSPVAIAGIFFFGTVALSIAAMASILVLLHSLYNATLDTNNIRYIVPSGLMGALFFITSIITQSISRYIRKTEELMSASIITATDLNTLNQFIVQRMITGIIVINDIKEIQVVNATANQLLHSPLHPHEHISGNIEKLYDEWMTNPKNNNAVFQDKAGLPAIKVSFSKLETSNQLTIIFIENQSALTQQAQHLKLASLGRLSASIAHEIRNPLSAINQSSQLLSESDQFIESDKRLLNIIENNVIRLNNIVNNVLDISRKTPAAPTSTQIESTVKGIIEQCQNRYKAPIDCIIDIETDMTVLFDESQLQQVLYNLIDNAITYSNLSNNGYWVKITGWIENDIPIISINDKGMGVPKENIDHIFEPFFTTNPNGTGLGLYICKDLCEMNQALLDYIIDDNGKHQFRIRFSHREKRLLPN